MENNKYALNIYPRAQADLEDIFRYISEELCNPSAAAALIDDIDESLDRVCLNPLMCPLVRSSPPPKGHEKRAAVIVALKY